MQEALLDVFDFENSAIVQFKHEQSVSGRLVIGVDSQCDGNLVDSVRINFLGVEIHVDLYFGLAGRNQLLLHRDVLE